MYLNWHEPVNAGGKSLTWYTLTAKDTNGHTITRQIKSSWKTEVENLAILDKNSDNYLDREEISANLDELSSLFRNTHGLPHQQFSKFQSASGFTNIFDSNNDNVIEFREFMKPYTFPVVGLDPYTQYTLVVAAENEASWCEGVGDPSQNVTISTVAPTAPDQIGSVSASKASGGSAKVKLVTPNGHRWTSR